LYADNKAKRISLRDKTESGRELLRYSCGFSFLLDTPGEVG